LPDEAYCQGGDGGCNSSINPGVFLKHVPCEAKNPFWNGNSVDIPGGRNSPAQGRGIARLIDSTSDYQMTTASGAMNMKVTHWQIGMLKSTPPSLAISEGLVVTPSARHYCTSV